MGKSFQAEDRSIDSEIVAELIGLMPDTWKSAILHVRSLRFSEGSEQHSITITNPEKQQGVVMPSDRLCFTIRKLSSAFLTQGKSWREVIYTISLVSEGEWQYTVDYKH